MSGAPPTRTCDGTPLGTPCQAPIAVECECALCSHEDQDDRYHSCLAHRDDASFAHSHEHGGTRTRWKVYEMPRATEASPPPAEDKGPLCDGSATSEKPCQTPPSFECACRRCATERDPGERYHACVAHKGAAADRHRQVRKRPAEWYAYWPPERPAKPTLPTVPSRDFTLPEEPQGGATGPLLKWSAGTGPKAGPFPSPEFEKAQRELQRLVYGEESFGPSADEIMAECHALTRLLLAKNHKYGDSALNPRRVFAKADAVEQIKVRIDDKISRIEMGDASIEDEDVIQDLLGYLILLRIATKRKALASAKKDP